MKTTLFIYGLILALTASAFYSFGQTSKPPGDNVTCARPNSAAGCNCYYTSDCSGTQGCYACSGGGSHTGQFKTGNFDGNCASAALVGIEDVNLFADALEHWLLAYELAGIRGGGEPDATLINVAKNFNLPTENHTAIRNIAMHIVYMYAGRTSYVNNPHRTGYFTLPFEEPQYENGILCAMPQEVLQVGRIIRQAFVTKIRTQGKRGIFDRMMSQLHFIIPAYNSFGRCEFPHPQEHNHPYIYQDVFDCLAKEIRPPLNEILSNIVSKEKQNESHPGCPIITFEITPNPVRNESDIRIVVEIPQCGKNTERLVIRDVLGNILLFRPLQIGMNSVQINSSDLNNNKICRAEVIMANQIVATRNLVILE